MYGIIELNEQNHKPNAHALVFCLGAAGASHGRSPPPFAKHWGFVYRPAPSPMPQKMSKRPCHQKKEESEE